MTKKKITNCGDCAYIRKSGEKMWCPFLDCAVSKKVACENFIHHADSPQTKSLFASLAESADNTGKTPFLNKKDIAALILTIMNFAVAIALGVSISLIFFLGL